MTDYFDRFDQGDVREQILLSFRDSLRELVDPTTAQPPSEDLIRQSTIQGGRFWVEANDIDLLVMGVQRRDYFLGQQVDPRTSSTAFLENFHGPASNLPRLLASGSSGNALATASPGAVYIGSTTLGDPLATQATDPAGLRYQVFLSATTPDSGTITLAMVAIDTGEATNLPVGTQLKWINPPPGSTPFATVSGEDFEGGTAQETDQDWGNRIFSARSGRPRAGNAAHFMFWASQATNAVGAVFVYACAQNAGSVLVAIAQKRGSAVGPLARCPAPGTMSIVTGYIVPPGSPVVPEGVYVLALGVRPEPVDLSMRIGLRKFSKSGWADPTPWPGYVSAPARVKSAPAPTQTAFSITSDTKLPLSAGVPQLMVWNPTISAFERLSVASIIEITPFTRYDVVLTSAPQTTIATNLIVSPYSYRTDALAQGIGAYFDSLGAGEVVDSTTDMRFARAFRRPTPDISSPYQISSEIVDFVRDALGGNIGGSSLDFQSETTPPIGPISLGPFMFVAGNIGVYSSS
jgi:hypothetical protein